jgi:hypothetical protein
MTQTVPVVIELDPAQTGLTLGYRVLTIARASSLAFRTTGVSESAVAGTYIVSGGVAVPDAGGYIVAGTVGVDLKEIAVLPVDSRIAAIKAVTDQLDVSAVTQVLANSAGYLTITAGLTFSETVSGLPIQADWQTGYWTLKDSAKDLDSAAIVQIMVTNPGDPGDGLQVLLGSVTLPSGIVAGSAALIVDQGAGTARVYLTDDLTALLSEAKSIGWDVKFIDAAGDSVGRRGKADIVLTETKVV